jgi:uncharacterized protein
VLKRRLGLVAAGVIFLVAGIASAFGEVPVPPFKARVTDLTGTLNAPQTQTLESRLAEFERAKGSQVAVLILPSTQPETPAQYGVRVYDEWKLGRKGIDDGVLVLVAKDDRRVWIVTGRGVEGPLPDAAVKRIVEEDITPRFKQGDFYGGIHAGVERIMRTIEGEPLPPPRHAGQQSPLFEHVEWLIPAFIILMVAQSLLNTIFGRALGSGLTGGIAGLFAWIIVGSLVIGLIVGVIAFVFGLFRGSPVMHSGGRGSGGGWGSGGGFSGGGDFGGGGGGFSGGGGGSTAGGGAGGSW